MVTSSADSYLVWLAKGSMSLRTCGILCAAGIVTLGWVMAWVYGHAGKTPWVGGLIFILFMLGLWLHFAFAIAATVVYLLAWYFIHKTIRGYEERFYQESQKEHVS